MNPETTLVWHPLRDKLTELKQHCLREQLDPPHWERVENSASGGGMPDLNWCWNGVEGWLELKHRSAPPVEEDTDVVIDTVTAGQRLWWRERHAAGGRCYVMIRIANEYILLEAHWAAFNLGKTTMEGLYRHAKLVMGRNELNAELLLRTMMS